MQTFNLTAVAAIVLALTCCSPAEDDSKTEGESDAHAPERSPFDPITEADLDPLSNEEIWELGVARLGWSPDGAPQGWGRDDFIQRFLEDEKIKDFHDGLLDDALRYESRGYDKD